MSNNFEELLEEFFPVTPASEAYEDSLRDSDYDWQKSIVKAMINEHLTIKEAATIFEVSEKTIRSWLKKHYEVGLDEDKFYERRYYERELEDIMESEYMDEDTGELHMTEDDYKQLRKEFLDKSKRYGKRNDCLYAYERDYSLKTQVARRGSEATPVVDYIAPKSVRDTVLKTHSSHFVSNLIDFSENNMGYKITDLRRSRMNIPNRFYIFYHPLNGTKFMVTNDYLNKLLLNLKKEQAPKKAKKSK